MKTALNAVDVKSTAVFIAKTLSKTIAKTAIDVDLRIYRHLDQHLPANLGDSVFTAEEIEDSVDDSATLAHFNTCKVLVDPTFFTLSKQELGARFIAPMAAALIENMMNRVNEELGEGVVCGQPYALIPGFSPIGAVESWPVPVHISFKQNEFQRVEMTATLLYGVIE